MDVLQDEPLIGKFIGSYLIKEELGEGSYGTVYLGVHPTIERKAAIKVLNHQFSRNQEIANRFVVEAKAVNKISHPNIIQVFDFGTLEDGRLFYVMEYVDGTELSHLLEEEGILEMGMVDEIFSQLAKGLDEAHAAGIIHRDLKPGNIIVSRTPRGINLKIFDFGIAKLLEKTEQNRYATGAGEVMGTPAYMSPEQARADKSKISSAADIYSLGVIVYQMLSGILPINNDDSIADLIVAILQLKPHLLKEIVSGIPDGMSEVVAKALEKEPEDRYRSAGEFYREFKSTLFNPLLSIGPGINTAQLMYVTNEEGQLVLSSAGTPLADHVPPPLEPVTPKRRGRGGLYFAAAIMLLLVLGAATFRVYQSRKAKGTARLRERAHTWQVGYLQVGKREYRYLYKGKVLHNPEALELDGGVVTDGHRNPIVDLRWLKLESPEFYTALPHIKDAMGLYVTPSHLCHPKVQQMLTARTVRPLFLYLAKMDTKTGECLSKLRQVPLYLQLPPSAKASWLPMLKGLLLKGLFLNDTKLGNESMTDVAALETIETLSLNNTKIKGDGLEKLVTLTAVRELYLRGVPIADADCVHLAKFPNLEVLSLDKTRVTDACMALLNKDMGLRQLHLLNTKVGDQGLKIISGFSGLEQLSLSYTRVTSTGLSHVATLKKLQMLSLGGTAVKDSGLVYIARLRELSRLYLYNTKITNAGLIHFAQLSSLEELYLDGTRISDVGLQLLRWHLKLRVLSFSGCAVSLEGLLRLRRLGSLESINVKRSRCGCECVQAARTLFPAAKITGARCKLKPKNASAKL